MWFIFFSPLRRQFTDCWVFKTQHTTKRTSWNSILSDKFLSKQNTTPKLRTCRWWLKIVFDWLSWNKKMKSIRNLPSCVFMCARRLQANANFFKQISQPCGLSPAIIYKGRNIVNQSTDEISHSPSIKTNYKSNKKRLISHLISIHQAMGS